MPLNAEDLRNFDPASIMRLAKIQGLDTTGKTLEDTVNELLGSSVADRMAQAADLDEQFEQSPQFGRDTNAIQSHDRPSLDCDIRREEQRAEVARQSITQDSSPIPETSLEVTEDPASVCHSDPSLDEGRHIAHHQRGARLYAGPGTIYHASTTPRPTTPPPAPFELYKGPGTIYSPRKSPRKRNGRITKSRPQPLDTAPPRDPLEYLVPCAPSPDPSPAPPAGQDTAEPPTSAPPEEPFADADLSLAPPTKPLVYTSLSAVYALHHLDDRDLQAAAVLANLKPRPSPTQPSPSQPPPTQTQSQPQPQHARPSRAKTPTRSTRSREYAVKRAKTARLYHQLRGDAAQARRMNNVRAFAEARGDWIRPCEDTREVERVWPAHPGLQLGPTATEDNRTAGASSSHGHDGVGGACQIAGAAPDTQEAGEAAVDDALEESDEEVDELDPSSDDVPISRTARSLKRSIQDTRDGRSSLEALPRRPAHPSAPQPVVPSHTPPEAAASAPPSGHSDSHLRTILPAPVPSVTGSASPRPRSASRAPTLDAPHAPSSTPAPTPPPTAPAPAAPKRTGVRRIPAGTLFSAYGPPVAGAVLAGLQPPHARPHAHVQSKHVRNVAGPYALVDAQGRRVMRYVRQCGTYIEVWEVPSSGEDVQASASALAKTDEEEGRRHGRDGEC
ncbi:hypothetical protein PsYK624_113920 [Phanerochaete sordida]|uniref:Uncharacterized protein n=1 Tax=Phanerochaete sordida TaxID=48140 RepID=A0A9P3GHV0_9APHY|nr:hypothetical protein PsYK624_113920 [Phanerochaete sordida]